MRTSAVEHHHAEADRFERWYEEMAKSRFANAFAYGRAKIDRLLNNCLEKLPPGARVLDVGCGTGEYVRRATELGFLASGIEPAEAMRKVALEKNPSSTILDGIATALPFPDNTFDLVICIEVLRYLHREDNRQALREMHRVLAPGGRMFSDLRQQVCARRVLPALSCAQAVAWRARATAALPHCEFTTPTQIDREVREAGVPRPQITGVLFAPMRVLYKVSSRLASRIAPKLEPVDDAICAKPGMRPFAGHLVTVARR